jgi:hypothetical protein
MFIILAGAGAGLSRSSTSRAGSWVSLSLCIQGRGRSAAQREGQTSTTRGWSTAGIVSFNVLGSLARHAVPPLAARAVVAPRAPEDRPRRRALQGRRSCSGAVLPLPRYGTSARRSVLRFIWEDPSGDLPVGRWLLSPVRRWRLEKSSSPARSPPPSALGASGSLYLSSPLERRRGRGQGCSGVCPEAIAAVVGPPGAGVVVAAAGAADGEPSVGLLLLRSPPNRVGLFVPAEVETKFRL